MLTLEQIHSGLYKVTYSPSNKYIGEIYMEIDGYFVFQPINDSGYFNEYSLELIFNKLKELNNDWDNHLISNFL